MPSTGEGNCITEFITIISKRPTQPKFKSMAMSGYPGKRKPSSHMRTLFIYKVTYLPHISSRATLRVLTKKHKKP